MPELPTENQITSQAETATDGIVIKEKAPAKDKRESQKPQVQEAESDKLEAPKPDGPKPKSPKPEGRKHRKKDAYATLQKDLIARLYHLQTQGQQICESYLANLDNDISTLTDFLDGSSEVQKPKDAKAKTMATWDKTLDRIKLKTSKGRRKDLRKIDRAVRAMMESAFE